MTLADEQRRGPGRTRSSRPRPTSTRSGRLRVPRLRRASTCPATRAARAPTRGCARAIGDRADGRRAGGHRGDRPRAVADAVRARRGAGGRGARRGALVVPDQRRHARATTRLPRARRRSARASSSSATRTPRVVDGLVLSRRHADLRRAGVRARSWGWRTASRPSRCRAAIAAADGPRAVFIVSPTYYGMAADVDGLRRGLPRRGRAARRRPGLGPALRLPPRRCRRARSRWAPTRC